jgi:hypothetical protein
MLTQFVHTIDVCNLEVELTTLRLVVSQQVIDGTISPSAMTDHEKVFCVLTGRLKGEVTDEVTGQKVDLRGVDGR